MSGFEDLVDQAWPAVQKTNSHGWWLRYSGGVTKRANSAWPATEPDDLAAAIESAERFYAERDHSPTFMISDDARPEGLDGVLADRGYDAVDTTLIMTADLVDDLPVTRNADIATTPSPEWLAAWWAVDGRYATGLTTATEIVTGVPASYAAVEDGVGRAVLQGDWLGIYCMAVAPHARRRGVARDVLHALLNDGRARGARSAYLCVGEQNAGARALYEGTGFRCGGRYHYRVRRPDRC